MKIFEFIDPVVVCNTFAVKAESLEQAFEKLRSNFRLALNIPYSSLRK